ncbi:MAG: serpin family protein [Bacteroidia bacterium]
MEEIILALKRLFMNDILPLKRARAEEFGGHFQQALFSWDPAKFSKYSSAVNDFSSQQFRLWYKHHAGSGMISGAGLSVLLTMMLYISDNDSEQEFREMADPAIFPNPALMGELLEALDRADRWARFRLKNALWYHQGIVMNSGIREAFKNFFQTSGGPLNFSSERAQQKVNSWAKEVSNGRISSFLELLQGNMIFAQMIMMKGVWRNPFEKMGSRTDLFFPYDKRPVAIEMMRASGSFPVLKMPDWEAIFLPFGTESFSCILAMPEKGQKLPDVHGIFEPAKWKKESAISTVDISVSIPLFSLNTVTYFGPLLREMGLSQVFDPEKADFSKMSEEPLWLDQVIQGVHFEVNETGIGDNRFAKTKLRQTPSEPNLPELIFNRPFYIAVIENHTGLLLLQGVFEGDH